MADSTLISLADLKASCRVVTADDNGLVTFTKVPVLVDGTELGGVDISQGIVIGEGATATCVCGEKTDVFVDNVAIGTGAVANQEGAIAIGCSIASGMGAVSIGPWATASGYYSTALGNLACASGDRSTALGDGTCASGCLSMALGRYAYALGDCSTALGPFACASGCLSMAFGNSARASGTSTVAIGSYSCAYDGSINIMTTKESWYVECAATRGNEILLYSENTCQYIGGNTSTACGCYGCVSKLKVDREGVLTVNDKSAVASQLKSITNIDTTNNNYSLEDIATKLNAILEALRD